jgi:H+/Cl- antiporter ClcA
MGSLMKRDKKVEKNKRFLFMGVSAAGVAATFVAPILGVPLIAAGAYLGYDWFKFRAKRGMRF